MKFEKFEKVSIQKIDLNSITGGRYTVIGTGSAGGRSLEDRRYTNEFGGDEQIVCDVVSDSE